ncbi:MAG: hypothetical protein K2I06_00515 [Ruminococcus sp.]|nr:hypothetical protein [Ruminococcus sp.]
MQDQIDGINKNCNNSSVFPDFFPEPTLEQRTQERTIQAILNARALYPNCSLAHTPELRKASGE